MQNLITKGRSNQVFKASKQIKETGFLKKTNLFNSPSLLSKERKKKLDTLDSKSQSGNPNFTRKIREGCETLIRLKPICPNLIMHYDF